MLLLPSILSFVNAGAAQLATKAQESTTLQYGEPGVLDKMNQDLQFSKMALDGVFKLYTSLQLYLENREFYVNNRKAAEIAARRDFVGKKNETSIIHVAATMNMLNSYISQGSCKPSEWERDWFHLMLHQFQPAMSRMQQATMVRLFDTKADPKLVELAKANEFQAGGVEISNEKFYVEGQENAKADS